jgi:CubicO group peptidase (beta-lactamase class C family)
MTIRSSFRTRASLPLLAALLYSGCQHAEPPPPRPGPTTFAAFEQDLEALRVRLRIPGMSVAIARDGEVVWARGFGWADVERRVPATPESIYHLASLTKPFASTVLLQLVDEGRLDLDAPAASFGIDLPGDETVRVRHLLSHTAGQPPGTRYRYDGHAFGELGKVIEGTTGRSFAVELTERILRPLDLRHTAPNPHDERNALDEAGLDRAAIEQHLVTEYARARGRGLWPSGLFGPIRPIAYATSFHTSAGLVASAPDVARFSVALDEGLLLSDSLRDRAMRPATTPAGDPLPYGLGWFVQEHEGVRLVWHYGHWFGSSSLIVKVPERGLTFVLLANADELSRMRRLGDHADLTRSPAAMAFVAAFAGGTDHGSSAD